MKLNNRALMIAGGIGVGVWVLYAILNGATNAAPELLTRPQARQIEGFLGIITTLLCICGGILMLGVGFLYSYLAAKEGPVTIGNGAAGGAIALAVAGLIGGILGACVRLAAPLLDPRAQIAQQTAATVVGAVGFACLGLILSAVIGAIGGVIGAATVGKGSTAGTPPASSI